MLNDSSNLLHFICTKAHLVFSSIPLSPTTSAISLAHTICHPHSASPKQDLDKRAPLQQMIQDSCQFADVLENQITTYNDPKWINFILSSACLNSAMHNICLYLTAIKKHEKYSSHTHPQNWKEHESQSFTLFHHC